MGQSLTLKCSIVTVRGITSRVDIIWNSDGTELERTERLNDGSIVNHSVMYTEFYTIPQLSTLDEARVVACDVLINTIPPVMATDSVTLNVTGKCLQWLAYLYLLYHFTCSSLYQHQYITIWSHTRSYGR